MKIAVENDGKKKYQSYTAFGGNKHCESNGKVWDEVRDCHNDNCFKKTKFNDVREGTKSFAYEREKYATDLNKNLNCKFFCKSTCECKNKKMVVEKER